MSQDPFPFPPGDAEEPGSVPLPSAVEDAGEGMGQGLYICLPAEQLTLAGFAQDGEFAADELAFELHLTPASAAGQMDYAGTVARRLPATFAALAAGQIHPVHVRIIEDETRILSAEDAATADQILSQQAPSQTFGELRHAAHKLVLKLDPEAARKRMEAARGEAHVRRFRETSGNGGMVARELPSDEVLASWQHVEQRALDLRAAGMPGTLQELRVRAYLDLLQERDSRDQPPGPGHGPGSPGPVPAPAAGPSLAALVTLTIPWATWQARSEAPGEADGFGPLDGDDARDLAAAAARHPRTRWCLTVVNPDGTAAAHACLPGRHPPPGTGPPHHLPRLTGPLLPVARGPCDHARAETGYHPSRTCECNLVPLCRHNHRCKQAEGWRLEQPEPGVLVWHTPAGRTYATTATIYPV